MSSIVYEHNPIWLPAPAVRKMVRITIHVYSTVAVRYSAMCTMMYHVTHYLGIINTPSTHTIGDLLD